MHGEGETAAQAVRRIEALQSVRSINTAEVIGAAAAGGDYESLDQLSKLAPEPARVVAVKEWHRSVPASVLF